ncbi:hypothetical protein CBS101457_000151 [Exobasidium rhododendri]|nr:hypothetical protein CBS101457_000151 [Exobasidium rhododendri]
MHSTVQAVMLFLFLGLFCSSVASPLPSPMFPESHSHVNKFGSLAPLPEALDYLHLGEASVGPTIPYDTSHSQLYGNGHNSHIFDASAYLPPDDNGYAFQPPTFAYDSYPQQGYYQHDASQADHPQQQRLRSPRSSPARNWDWHGASSAYHNTPPAATNVLQDWDVNYDYTGHVRFPGESGSSQQSSHHSYPSEFVSAANTFRTSPHVISRDEFPLMTSSTASSSLQRHFDPGSRWAYTLLHDQSVPATASENDDIYRQLTPDQKKIVVQRLHESVPHTKDYIAKRLRTKGLKEKWARMLLNGNNDEVEEVCSALYTAKLWNRGTLTHTWMFDLSREDKIKIIESMAQATLQGADRLRDRFLKKNITPEIAKKILEAADDEEECRRLARKYDLYIRGVARNEAPKKALPWQYGCTDIQRKAVIQRAMGTGQFRKETAVYDVLAKTRIPLGYGLEILHADEDKFLRIVAALRDSRKPLPG